MPLRQLLPSGPRLAALLLPLLACAVLAAAPPLRTRHVIFITTDGLRWQEVFTGAEEALISKLAGGVAKPDDLRKEFWRDTPEERRRTLMPFLWGEVAARGQLFGNRHKGGQARVLNGHNFSYPGYNELITGHADPRITSNSKIPNANTNLLEWLHTRPAFTNRAAVFANWDVFPFIFNRTRAGIPVWTGLERTSDPVTHPRRALMEQLVADQTRTLPGMTWDTFIHRAATDHLRAARPRALYIGYGETDEWAHEGFYDRYLRSAHHVDRFLRELWELTQSLPEYRDQTTFILSTDHGRGGGPVSWKNHGEKVEGADAIWLAVWGPDTPALGERANHAPLTQSQLAATMARFLGEDWRAFEPRAGAPVEDVFPAAR